MTMELMKVYVGVGKKGVVQHIKLKAGDAISDKTKIGATERAEKY